MLLPTGDAAEWPKLAMGLKGNRKTRYIVAKMGTDSGKVFYSINGGRTWLRIPGPIEPASYKEWTNLVSVHPLNSKRMIAGSVRMSCTIDRFTWTPTTGSSSTTRSTRTSSTSRPMAAFIVPTMAAATGCCAASA